MKPLIQSIERIFQKIADAIKRIFGPSDNNYPKTGVQPYEGDYAEESRYE